ncbi:MAG: hypothetical protein ACMUHB_04465 [Thermoplasmatota archaeon]
MARIARCTKCGHLMSEVWKNRESCEVCSGNVEHINEGIGFLDRVPRLLNAGGIALDVFAVLYLAYKILTDDLGRSEGISVMVLITVGIVMIVASLLVQVRIGAAAIRKVKDREGQRPLRRVKGSSSVRKGPVDLEDRVRNKVPRATKLPVRER